MDKSKMDKLTVFKIESNEIARSLGEEEPFPNIEDPVIEEVIEIQEPKKSRKKKEISEDNLVEEKPDEVKEIDSE